MSDRSAAGAAWDFPHPMVKGEVSPYDGGAKESAGAGDHRALPDRERLCNDQTNTSVMAALIGGFAYSNLQELQAGIHREDPDSIDVGIYLFNVIAVHLCTCSCLMSAFLYMVINRLKDESVEEWGQSWPWRLLLPFPMAKFAMGCVFYLVSVLLISFRDLEFTGAWRYVALVIGLGSVLTVLATGALVMFSK
mmetsp:Transcript_133052/g.413708  ORF Transcript_133052/g.413708 Transcript_133052/m.413708 type:complete len:193 (+) Transcript_133052:25-603(+)